MIMSLINLIRPYIQRKLLHWGAEHTAAYLQQRRAQRLGLTDEEPEEAEAVEETPPPRTVSFRNAFWFTMSGILLGSALGFLGSYFIREQS